MDVWTVSGVEDSSEIESLVPLDGCSLSPKWCEMKMWQMVFVDVFHHLHANRRAQLQRSCRWHPSNAQAVKLWLIIFISDDDVCVILWWRALNTPILLDQRWVGTFCGCNCPSFYRLMWKNPSQLMWFELMQMGSRKTVKVIALQLPHLVTPADKNSGARQSC